MVIYKVTHIPTGNFYFGFEETITQNLDPMQVFESKGFNGIFAMNNTHKDILYKNIPKDEIKKMLADLIEIHAKNVNFIGLKHEPKKSTTIKETKPEIKSESTSSKS
jgi:hypothetical protein